MLMTGSTELITLGITATETITHGTTLGTIHMVWEMEAWHGNTATDLNTMTMDAI